LVYLTLTRLLLHWQPIILILTHPFSTAFIQFHTHNYIAEWYRSGRGCGNTLSLISPSPWVCDPHSPYPRLSILSRNLIPCLPHQFWHYGFRRRPTSIGAPHSVIAHPTWTPYLISNIRDLKIPLIYWGCEVLSSHKFLSFQQSEKLLCRVNLFNDLVG